MKLFVREKKFYKTFFPLLIVIVLQQLAALIVNLVDNLMLGRYTELALNGATLVNQIQFVLQQFAAGTGVGIVVLASQYWGKREIEPIRRIISLGLKCGMLAGILFFAVTAIAPAGVLGLLTNDQEVVAEGVKYLKIMCWTYLIFGVSNSLMYSLQSVETAFVGTVMSISTIIINACLNYCFIYGNFGAPEMGIVGAAIATLVSRIVELIIIVSYVLLIDKKLHMKLRHLLMFDFTYLRDYIKVSTPLVISGAMWGVAQAAQTAILGHISATTIAANSIATVVYNIFAVVGTSCTNAASVTIGKTIGENRLDRIKPYARTLQMIFLGIGLLSGILLFLLREPVIRFYTVSEETRQLALNFLLIQSVTIIGTCYEFPVASGIIAGGGDTKYPAIVENLFMWLFIIPSAALSAFVFKFPPTVTFCCLKADQILKCIPNGIRCNRYKWIRQLTRETKINEIKAT
jgi:putative MATE family efflux protein